MPDSSVDVAGKAPWLALVKKCFQFNKGILHGNPNVLVSSGAPASFNAKLGTLCWDVTGGDGYIATDAGSTWVKINA
jgi:hypothetical protein